MIEQMILCDAAECEIRLKCMRYAEHLRRIDNNALGHAIYLPRVIDLGWGKTYTRDVSHGCREYLPIDKP